MKNIELTITRVSPSSFEGEIFASEIGLDTGSEDMLLNFYGEYSVYFDDDIPLVEIENVVVEFAGRDYVLEPHNYDYDACCEWIEQKGPLLDWLADRQAAFCDYYYDLNR